MLGLSSFRSQLLLLIIGLFTLVLASVFIAVNKANQNNARVHIEEALGITSFTFQRDLLSRNNVLIERHAYYLLILLLKKRSQQMIGIQSFLP